MEIGSKDLSQDLQKKREVEGRNELLLCQNMKKKNIKKEENIHGTVVQLFHLFICDAELRLCQGFVRTRFFKGSLSSLFFEEKGGRGGGEELIWILVKGNEEKYPLPPRWVFQVCSCC